jgi:hypothetical protein
MSTSRKRSNNEGCDNVGVTEAVAIDIREFMTSVTLDALPDEMKGSSRNRSWYKITHSKMVELELTRTRIIAELYEQFGRSARYHVVIQNSTEDTDYYGIKIMP